MRSLGAKAARIAQDCVSPLIVEGYWDFRLDPDRCQEVPLQPPEHGTSDGPVSRLVVSLRDSNGPLRCTLCM